MGTTQVVHTIPDSDFSKIVEDAAKERMKEWHYGDSGDAFAHVAIEWVMGISDGDAFDAAQVGIAGHDHGLDGMYRGGIGAKEEFLIQAKSTSDFSRGSFGEDVVTQFTGCLDWLSDPNLYPFAQGHDFKLAGRRYRDSLTEKCKIQMRLVVFGDLTEDGRRRFEAEKARIAGKYPDHSLELIDFDGLKRLYLKALELEEDFKDAVRLKVVSAETFEKTKDGLRSIVATVPASEFAKIYRAYGRRLFFYNVRFYLEETNVNDAIKDTLSKDEKKFFWHLNNGIVIVCQKAEWADASHSELVLVAPQIVNGCQTVATLGEDEGVDLSGVDVLTRIIQSSDQEFSLRITTCTNTQNPNTLRDLAANLKEQRTIQGLFNALNPPYFYERKRKEFKNLDPKVRARYSDPGTKKPRLVENDDVANAYLSFALQKPTEARTKARLLFNTQGDFYGDIFYGKKTAEEYLFPTLLARKVDDYLKEFRKNKNRFEVDRKKKIRLGQEFSQKEVDEAKEYERREALPYARTQILGLAGVMVITKCEIYNSRAAKKMLKVWYEKPELITRLMEFCVYVIRDHSANTKDRDPTIDFDNAYKLEQTYRDLVEAMKVRLNDKFVQSPLSDLPD